MTHQHRSYWHAGDNQATSRLLSEVHKESDESLNTLVSLLLTPCQRMCSDMLGRLNCRKMEGGDIANIVLTKLSQKLKTGEFHNLTDPAALRKMLTKMAKDEVNSAARIEYGHTEIRGEADLPADAHALATAAPLDQSVTQFDALDELSHLRQKLTADENILLNLKLHGAHAEEIAEKLHISRAAIYYRLKEIFKKLRNS